MKFLFFVFIFLLSARIAHGQAVNMDLFVSRIISKTEDGHRVEITIANSSKIRGFVKIQEIVPDYYFAQKEKISGADFSFSGNKVNYVWINFPSEEKIKVVYFLKWIGKTDTNHSQLKNITGELSYLVQNQTKKIPIITIHEEMLPEKKGIKLAPIIGSQSD